jgi:hypothetical protein
VHSGLTGYVIGFMPLVCLSSNWTRKQGSHNRRQKQTKQETIAALCTSQSD